MTGIYWVVVPCNVTTDQPLYELVRRIAETTTEARRRDASLAVQEAGQ